MPRRFDPTYNLDDRRDQDHWDAERDRISREPGGTQYEPVRHDTSYVSDESIGDSDDDLIRAVSINSAMDKLSHLSRDALQRLEVDLKTRSDSEILRSDTNLQLYDELLIHLDAVQRLLAGKGRI